MRSATRLARIAVAAGTVASVAATAHTFVNLGRLRAPKNSSFRDSRLVSVLIPARNEAQRIGQCISALRQQVGVANLEILVLDDASSDGTKQVLHHFQGDPGLRLIDDIGEPPAGWLGKSWACWNLARHASGDILIFIDADVVLEPTAIAACAGMFDNLLADQTAPAAVSLYPRQLADGIGQRLVQPLLQWSWLTFLPLRLAESSSAPSMVAANGQFLGFTRDAYDAIGGHESVRGEVLEDIALFRNLKRVGLMPIIADGTSVASCHMYDDWHDLREGYSKSLWSAFGSQRGAITAVAALAAMYVLPALAALRGSKVGLFGYCAGVTGRVLVSRRVGGQVVPDSLAHPVSIVIFGYLTARSFRQHRLGKLQWKGRTLTA